MGKQKSAEDYLEVILVLSERLGQVRSIDIVNELGYSKPSISVAMKKLREQHHIVMDDIGFITLTESGTAIAQSVLDKHKLIKTFLTSIGVDDVTAAEDACKIEHDISEQTFEKLSQYIAKNFKV